MSQHTPGSWSRKYGNYVYKGDTSSNCGRLIAICEPTSKTQEDWDETFANARLIAAAPDLLEALEATIYVLELHHCADCKCSVCKNAKAAIAKAKGD